MAGIGRLNGKVSLITGASSGIGAGTAVLFCKLGAEVAITGRNSENLAKTAEKCEQENGKKPFVLVGDLTDEEFTKKLVEDTVNNAGIFEAGTIETTSLQQYDKTMNINVRSMYHTTMLAVPHLINTKGSIVNVSSICGIRVFAGELLYCMSKSAVDQFTRCIALELAPKQVRVNSVNPGVITTTEIFERSGMDEEAVKKFLDRCKVTHPLGRTGHVEEVATSIAFLASDSSSFITGNQFSIDGGRHVFCPR